MPDVEELKYDSGADRGVLLEREKERIVKIKGQGVLSSYEMADIE